MKICISGVAKFLTRDPLIKEEINLKIGQKYILGIESYTDSIQNYDKQ